MGLTETPSRRPRVLYVINAFNRGGAELGLGQLVRGGAFDGCDLEIVGLARGSGEPLADLRDLGVRVSLLSDQPRLSISNWLLSPIRLARRLRILKPDVMILSLPQANIAGRIAAIGRRVVVASFEHNTHLSKPIFERLFRLTSGRVDWLIADAAPTAVVARRRLYSTTPRQTFVLPLVTFPEEEAPPFRLPDLFTLVNAGRFSTVKNQASLIRAVSLLKSRGRDVRLILYGEGETRSACETLTAELDLDSSVVFAGFDPAWPNRPASAFVLSSLHEGLCIAALEAMNADLPVIAPRVGAIADYGVEGGVHFVEDLEPATLADAVEALMDSVEAQASARSAGRAMVQRRFGLSTTKQHYAVFQARLAAATTRP